jgi:hypothetical protein
MEVSTTGSGHRCLKQKVTIAAPNQEATMDTQLTRAARVQLARSFRRRHQTASSRAKRQILHEFIAVSGNARDHAAGVAEA